MHVNVWLLMYTFGKLTGAQGPTNEIGCDAMRTLYMDQTSQMLAASEAAGVKHWMVDGKWVTIADVKVKCLALNHHPRLDKFTVE